MIEIKVEEETKKLSVEDIAKICHEANKSYCRGINDYSIHDWYYAPEWQKESAIKGVKMHLAHLNIDGKSPSPSMSHDSWLAEKEKDGWQYGVTKDPAKKTHPCYLPYHMLPKELKTKDYLFGAIVHAIWEAGMAEDV